VSLFSWINFDVMGDSRGSLIAIEQNKSIPFEIKRAYYIFDTQQGISRGFHAHKGLLQVAICLSGSCRMMVDDGVNQENYILDSPSKGLLIGSPVWREMHDFTENCVLLVLASEYYDEGDYIRSYDEFIKGLEDGCS